MQMHFRLLNQEYAATRASSNLHEDWKDLTDTITYIYNVPTRTRRFDENLERVAALAEVVNINIRKQSAFLAKFSDDSAKSINFALAVGE